MRAVIGLLAVVVIGTGCGTSAEDCHNTKTCPPPDAGVTVIYLPNDAGATCDGVCAPSVVDSLGWSPVPFMLWRGSAMKLADTQCPSNAQYQGQVYYASPDQTPLDCPMCDCAPSTGACALPGTVTISGSPTCPGEAADAGVPFDPPSGWDGGCSTNDAIADVECDGGASCLATVGPMAPINAACVPTQAVVPKVVTWSTAAFGCAGDTNHGTCGNSSDVCVPAPPVSPPGFSICVSRDDDDPLVDCPAGYPKRAVYYLAGEDDRACAACECGPPQGDSCSASLVSFYADDVCSVQVGSVFAESSGPMCVSIPAGSPLGSKQASAPTYTPGTCQPSGGEPTGSVVPKHPVTVCCQD